MNQRPSGFHPASVPGTTSPNASGESKPLAGCGTIVQPGVKSGTTVEVASGDGGADEWLEHATSSGSSFFTSAALAAATTPTIAAASQPLLGRCPQLARPHDDGE